MTRIAIFQRAAMGLILTLMLLVSSVNLVLILTSIHVKLKVHEKHL